METKIIVVDPLYPSREALKEAAEILRNGGTVAFPTETVYGLGAHGLDVSAIKKIYKAKGRPSDNPLILHIGQAEMLNSLVSEVNEDCKKLIDAFWPGPLTIIFPKNNKVPLEVTGGLNTVAVRCPSHPIALELLKLSKIPVAAPSANLSGKPSPTEANHVIVDLNGKIDMIIDGGECQYGLESTVIDMTACIPMILRPGAITKRMIESILGKVEEDPTLLHHEDNNQLIPKSPGMKYKHYAPSAEMMIVTGEIPSVIETINKLTEQYEQEGYHVGIIATEETKSLYSAEYIFEVGSRTQPQTIAKNIFSVLRRFDDTDVDIILTEGFEEEEIGMAIMNRLYKAAGYKVIRV